MNEPTCSNCSAPIVAAKGETFMRMYTVDEDGNYYESWYCVDCTVQREKDE